MDSLMVSCEHIIIAIASDVLSKGQASCLDGRIRLVNGTVRTANEGNVVSVGGRVQLCVGGQWTDFCSLDRNRRTRWHQSDIDVACRQLRNENSCKSSNLA